MVSQRSLPEGIEPIDLSTYHRIPILGRISAGLPLYADEHVEGYTLTNAQKEQDERWGRMVANRQIVEAADSSKAKDKAKNCTNYLRRACWGDRRGLHRKKQTLNHIPDHL